MKNFYAGLSATFADAETTFDYQDPATGQNFVDRNSLNNLGINFLFDSRNLVNYPDKGFQVSMKNQLYRDWLGNDSIFNQIILTYDHYYGLPDERRIIMYRFYSAISFGSVPFQGQNVVQGDDIRGYSQGKYRDNQVYSIQTEYRHRFRQRCACRAVKMIRMAMADKNAIHAV